jgi:hypothetical protein
MSRIQCPHDSKPPFATQPFQDVLDSLRSSATANNFLENGAVLKMGVLVTAKRCCKTKTHKSLMTDKIGPVADRLGDRSLMAHLTFERRGFGNKQDQWFPRSGVVIASQQRIAEFVAALLIGSQRPRNPSLIRGFDIASNGMYWEVWHWQRLYIFPYIDLDIQNVPAATTFHQVYMHVATVITATTEKFQSMCDSDAADLEVFVTYNRRETSPGLFKFSLHLHWPTVTVLNISKLSAVLHVINDALPKMPKWVGGEPVEGTQQMLDTKPYGASNQLFRLPYCGKFGDKAAKMVPISVKQDAQQQWIYEERVGNVAELIMKSRTCSVFNEGTTELRVEEVERPFVLLRASLPSAGIVRLGAETPKDRAQRRKWLRFWEPVFFRIILPNWIIFRQAQMAALNVQTRTPDPFKPYEAVNGSLQRLNGYPASYRVEVSGDFFCEFDQGATPFVHMANKNAISYLVDFQKGRIAQLCHVCRPAGDDLVWRSFIQDGRLGFEIMDDPDDVRRECSDVVTVGKSEEVINFLFLYYREQVVFAAEKKKVFVYEERTGTWLTDTSGNKLLIKLVDGLNSRYKTYRRAKNSSSADNKLSAWMHHNPNAGEEDVDARKKKEDELCKAANRQVPNLLTLTIEKKEKFIKTLKSQDHAHVRETMEPFSHLVPLKDAKCLDVYTFELRESKPEHFFTSYLNAEKIDLLDSSVGEFEAWQTQVCCGDAEYVEYKLRCFGLCLTTMNFDRFVCLFLPRLRACVRVCVRVCVCVCVCVCMCMFM